MGVACAEVHVAREWCKVGVVYVYVCGARYVECYISISDGLLKMLYVILLHQQMQHPGAPRSTLHMPPSISAVSQDNDINNVTLALQTLANFNFGGLYKMHTYVPTCVHMYVHVCIHMYVHTYVHTYVCPYVCVRM